MVSFPQVLFSCFLVPGKMLGPAEILDPCKINLAKQTTQFREEVSRDFFDHVTTRADILAVLSTLLCKPEYTYLVAKHFRPLLLDLCARWLLDRENLEDKFEALCLLLEVHTEIYPIFAKFLKQPAFNEGPLAFVAKAEDVNSLDAHILHRILVAYYRILKTNRDLPRTLLWPLAPLVMLFRAPHSDSGVRYLAIRCYALQSGLIEGERVKLEKDVIGETSDVDCPIAYGKNVDGSVKTIDGWLLPIYELKRTTDARNAMLDPPDYFSHTENDSSEPIHPAELSPLTLSIHGILMLRSTASVSQDTTLIETPTTVQALRTLAAHLSLRVPVLLTSLPSSGKSLLLSHLAAVLRSDIVNPIVTIHLADTSLDARSLLGSYISSPTSPGTFEWREGVLVRAMREGRWVVFEDIDRASMEVLGLLKPLVESMGIDKWVGGCAQLEVPNRGTVYAADDFAIFATRSVSVGRNGSFATPTFYGAHKFYEMAVSAPTPEDLRIIVDLKFRRLAGAVGRALIRLWETIRDLGAAASTRDVGLRELLKLCTRVDNLIPAAYQSMDVDMEVDHEFTLAELFPNPTLREDMYLEARDVFFGAGATTTSARSHLEATSAIVAEHLGLSLETRDWLLQSRTPEFEVEKDVNGKTTGVRVGRTKLRARPSTAVSPVAPRPFAMHRPAAMLLSRIATAISLNEPVLLTGETGTGKTSAISHLAALLHRPLVSLNLSNQTESSDLLGGFKPVDARVPGAELQGRFLELFGGTFSRKRNAKFEESVRKAVQDAKWKRAAGLWLEAVKLAKSKIQARSAEGESAEPTPRDAAGEAVRKRRKTDQAGLNVAEAEWTAFERDVNAFEIQHVQGKSKFAFSFVEGPLVRALRNGDWVLLDEMNLATAETLECISGLLQGPTASIILTEQGLLEPVPRHPDFRLFACMNPATDVGKKDLPPNIRAAFTEIDVPPPDADRDTLLSIINQYISGCTVGDRGAIMDVAEFYSSVKRLAEERQIADGSNHRPHYSMRTLARALTFTSDTASAFSLRRALWEGCLMTFTMVLDDPSATAVTALARTHILNGVRNPASLLARDPSPPQPIDAFMKFGPFWLERGPLPEDSAEEYIMTPSVEKKLVDLARVIAAKRFPVLIEGPTSAGKTSSIEYLARRTGHRFVRINNHEHTDIQEYLGTYVSDSTTGKLVFRDGLLVQALRNGDWIVLDELNLAPTDVLEALNRLLDDNRELVIPETQEVVRPHPHFMLFATQNPPGLYAGRKVLSRAFRNRFLELHFQDVPQTELEQILRQRCRIAPTYAQRIVTVFSELQKRRQSSRVFESKHGFATLRDLFRWASRDAIGYDELAANGYMLLAERARKEDDKAIVKEVIESVMKVRIDEHNLYNFVGSERDFASYLGCPVPSSSQLVWTSAMQRLFVLVSRALRFNEPVLLVGETGCGKTSVCQVYAENIGQMLRGVNCHQNTETADLIGGLRPVRNRAALESQVVQEATSILQRLGHEHADQDLQALLSTIDTFPRSESLPAVELERLECVRIKLQRLSAMFEWHDGPLVESMRQGDVFLLDEISLADDSVLERLNSVLEPERTIVLAERGGDDSELPTIVAASEFKLVATMNPGGDYGKKELSPALRNRFTEIWVPPITDREDLERIVTSSWKYPALMPYTGPLLDFIEWLCAEANDRSIMSLRDILAWVTFSNAVYHPAGQDIMPANQLFHHAAHLTFLDGLNTLPQFSAFSRDALGEVRTRALHKLQELSEVPETVAEHVPSFDPTVDVQLGTFSIPRGPKETTPQQFSLQAPTTRDNGMRVVRACQLPKPILLEGSPGVGKTSLVTALANICGYQLCRINLSDQTDLVDLFGSDLPVEGGEPGQFAWKDAEFLTALQEGHWVLLDEMNLAPQAVLEGLNAVLDHRGTVYIPELGRSFTRHPSFRIFAAQNPLHQGGGRKGLPRSFLNRFTKVYVQELTSQDLLLVCEKIFPDCPSDVLRGMIAYTSRLSEEVVDKRSFGREGAPWEFNLRDVIRWGTLLQRGSSTNYPGRYVSTIFLQRFRNQDDRARASDLFNAIFPEQATLHTPYLSISPSSVQVGDFFASRCGLALGRRPGKILQSHLDALESIGTCVSNNWLTILSGPHETGKTTLVRTIANTCGVTLKEISVTSATDATDILGSFEEVNALYQLKVVANRLEYLLGALSTSLHECSAELVAQLDALRTTLRAMDRDIPAARAMHLAGTLREKIALLPGPWRSQLASLEAQLGSISSGRPSKLEWVDGPLVHALKEGHWLLLDGANLCSPSVLDRLNSLCEINGTLTLNERGPVDGEVQVLRPHPNFRIFMSVDVQYGELSRAMRNRGVEIALWDRLTNEDVARILDHLRLPLVSNPSGDLRQCTVWHEFSRRGLTALDSSRRTQITSSLPSAALIGEDSASCSVLQLASSLTSDDNSSPRSLANFLIRAMTPRSVYSLRRYLAADISSTDGSPAISLLLRGFIEGIGWRAVMSQRGVMHDVGLPHDFVNVQPMAFDAHVLPRAASAVPLNQKAGIIPLILRLFVATYLEETSSANRAAEVLSSSHITRRSKKSVQVDRAADNVSGLLEEIVGTGWSCLERTATTTEDGFIQNLLLNVLKLLSYAHHLGSASFPGTFDYSTAQVVVGWMEKTIPALNNEFPALDAKVEALTRSVSLTSGLGLMNIWGSLSSISNLSQSLPRLKQIQQREAAQNHQNSFARRSELLELMALTCLPDIAPEANEQALARLRTRVDENLMPIADDSSPDTKERWSDVLFSLGTLTALHHVFTSTDGSASATSLVLNTLDELVHFGLKNDALPIINLVSYQQLSWALSSDRKALPAMAASVHQWLEDIWNVTPDLRLHGPSVLFVPIELQSTLDQMDFRHKSIRELDSHQRTMSLNLSRYSTSLVIGSLSRASQAMTLLGGTIELIRRCFPGHSPISLPGETSPGDVFRSLTDVCPKTDHPGFRDAYTKHLHALLLELADLGSPSQPSLILLGRTWLALSRFLIELYVPDTPVDPAAMRQSARHFWEDQCSTLVHEKQLNATHEERAYNATPAPVAKYIHESLVHAEGMLVEISSGDVPANTRDLARLHAYWAEVAQFLAHVVSPSKIAALLTALSEGKVNALAQEGVIQESITAFCQRLSTAYEDHRDISGPVQLAVHGMKFGLRLVADGVSHAQVKLETIREAQALVAFPSVKSAELLGAGDQFTENAPVDRILAKLAGITLEVSLGISVRSRMQIIGTVHEQVFGLWSIERARHDQRERDNQSLYRPSGDLNTTTEADLEEQDFLALFPDFENALDEGSAGHTSNTNEPLVQEAHAVFLARCSGILFSQDSTHTPSTITHPLMHIRRSLLRSMLTPDGSALLPESLDGESQPFQISLMLDGLSELSARRDGDLKPYDFYLDSNIPEIKKAIPVLQSLLSRLDALVEEWPEQMVLHHLRTRCEAILGLALDSPVPKILNAIEQLHLLTDDWEKYAHRNNSLNTHQQALTELIVSWRRLELTCWKDLLRIQAMTFSDGASQWWFRLYEAIVCGVLSASEEEDQGTVGAVDAYLDKLVPLLDDYVVQSPIGQHVARMKLLASFCAYLEFVTESRGERFTIPLRRIRNVLSSTAAYYSQFSSNILAALDRQQGELEKEIRDFIKLASWRDVNVHALKQSAQRSHRQLYKCIRKFRDVLRQPVRDFLKPTAAPRATTSVSRVMNAPIDILTEHAPLPAFPRQPNLPSHLSNLDLTLSNFSGLVKGQLASLVDAVSASGVDELAVDIISVSEHLKKLPVPENLTAAQRQKLSKSHLVRKRKAWSDLLKELKRVGFAPNMKPQVLEQQSNMRWLREQLSMSIARDDFPEAEKGEEYVNRLTTLLPEVRGLLPHHNEDVSTRELQRAILLMESGFAIALENRSWISHAAPRYHQLQKEITRLRSISASTVVSSGPDVVSRLEDLRAAAGKLAHALREVLSLLREYEDNLPSNGRASSVSQELEELARSVEMSVLQVSDVLARVMSSSYPVLLKDELNAVSSTRETLQLVQIKLRTWAESGHPVDYFVTPVLDWFESHTILPPPEHAGLQSQDGSARLISSLLVNVQGLLALAEKASGASISSSDDNFVRESFNLLGQSTRALRLEAVLLQTASVIREVLSLPTDRMQSAISRLLPFLERYSYFVQRHLENHVEWTKSLLKLEYIVGSVIRTVAQEGFCKPPETEESGEGGEGAEVTGGTGLGDGTGDNNVSKEIEDESQVEGLKGEDQEEDEQVERAEEGNALEMSEDFGGEMQDVPEKEDGDGEEEEEEEDDGPQPEDQVGDLDSSDPAAVDEKLWGDKSGPEDQSNDKTDQDHSTTQQQNTEMTAKEKEGEDEKKGGKEPQDYDMPQAPEEDLPEEEQQGQEGEENGANGMPMDDHVQEAETLDLPEDMNLDGDENGEERNDDVDIGDMEDGDMMEDDEQPGDAQGEEEDLAAEDNIAQPLEEEYDSQENAPEGTGESAVAQPDIHDEIGDGQEAGDSSGAQDQGAANDNQEAALADNGSSSHAKAEENAGNERDEATEESNGAEAEPQQNAESAARPSGGEIGQGSNDMEQGAAPAPQQQAQQLSQSRRSLGDAMQDIIRRFDEIINPEGAREQETDAQTDPLGAPQLEYLQADDDSHKMQALGPALQEEATKLNDIKFADDTEVDPDVAMPDDVPEQPQSLEEIKPPRMSSGLGDTKSEQANGENDGAESAMTSNQVRPQHAAQMFGEETAVVPSTDISMTDEALADLSSAIELRLQQWQVEGHHDREAEDIWRQYESLTHDLSYALCEQLRLILEPTRATRLRGDYRTGKRLNMKKIIPYIASEFTKDKIWLRRTRASEREYQVLVSLDDSRSMAESHSVHLAYSTLALVSRALSRLEVGDIAIAKFGENVDVLHGFDSGPFTDQAGAKLVSAFHFDQKATQVLSLVETSLQLLQQARERRSMMSSSAAELWQLQIIISDGICQDHDRLRTVLRRAEEQRVMIVFIILDSLHTKVSTGSQGGATNSILTMNQVAYKTVNGRTDLHVERYLDTFPFEYYVVLRDVEALPEVLSGTLKQFFERISEE